MADENLPEAAVTEPQAEAPAETAALVAETAAAADAVVDTAAETPAEGTEAAPTTEPTLLEQMKPQEEAKPEEKSEAKPDAAAEEPKPADAAPDAEKPALEQIEYTYTLPETLKMDDALRSEVHSAFDAFRADPSNPQALIDLHNQAMQRHDAFLREEQYRVFNETRKGWRDQVMSDEEIGGPGHHTAMTAIARMRDRFASSARPGTDAYNADLQAFDGMLRATGVGDHPVFLKMLHRVAQIYDEPAPGPANISPAPQPRRGMKDLYRNGGTQ